MEKLERILIRASWICLIAAALILVLYWLIPATAIPEIRYTADVIFNICCPLFLAGGVALFLVANRRRPWLKWVYTSWGWVALGVAGISLLCIPIFGPSPVLIPWYGAAGLSLCWIIGTLALSMGVFFLARRLPGFLAGMLCVVGSLFLVFAIAELIYLFRYVSVDARWLDSSHSKYISQGAVPYPSDKETAIGIFPSRPEKGMTGHRQMRYGQELFDAVYTYNENDRRITPEAAAHPVGNLLVFGCSFSFGYGLNDEETWPWLLAKDLGSAWKVENYAYNGFGPQQMLAMLEDKKIIPPSAPVKQAVFLAIQDHLRRNSGLFGIKSPVYGLDEHNVAIRQGVNTDSRFYFLQELPPMFNGSQFVRQLSRIACNMLLQIGLPKFTEIYVAMLEKSAEILRRQYETTLTVLLWPDLEELGPVLREKNIRVLLASKMLKDWNKDGGLNYQIVPEQETHPNAKAARELANGLARYYRAMQLGY